MKKTTIVLLAVTIFLIISSCGGSGGQAETKTKANAERPKPNLENGKIVYDRACIACHMAGVAGAAKIDDKARWTESAAKGFETLHKHVINGVAAGEGKYGVMAPRGSCTDCTDKDLFDAVGYILNQAGVSAE